MKKVSVIFIILILFSVFYIGYKYNQVNTKDAVNNELSTLIDFGIRKMN